MDQTAQCKPNTQVAGGSVLAKSEKSAWIVGLSFIFSLHCKSKNIGYCNPNTNIKLESNHVATRLIVWLIYFAPWGTILPRNVNVNARVENRKTDMHSNNSGGEP